MLVVTANGVPSLAITEAVFGSFGVLAVLSWPHSKSYLRAVIIQCGGSAAFAMYFLLSGSPTASVASMLGMAQLIAAALIRDRQLVMTFHIITLSFLIGIAASMSFDTTTALACSGAAMSTFARLQRSTISMKICFLLASPFWLAHNIITGSAFALIVDFISISSGSAATIPLLLTWGKRPSAKRPRFGAEGRRVAMEFWQAARVCIGSMEPARLYA